MSTKKIKLTPEEKEENRLIKKQWAKFIRTMAKKGVLITETNN